MIAPKIGLYSADGPEYAGDLICGNLYDRLDEVIDDVDHAAEIVEPGDLVDYFAPLPSNIDKYSRGSVLIVAGSAQYPGAAIMAASLQLARVLVTWQSRLLTPAPISFAWHFLRFRSLLFRLIPAAPLAPLRA